MRPSPSKPALAGSMIVIKNHLDSIKNQKVQGKSDLQARHVLLVFIRAGG